MAIQENTKTAVIIDDSIRDAWEDQPKMPIREKTNLVAIVDDDHSIRIAVQDLLEAVGLPVQGFASAEEFLSSGKQRVTACLIVDIRMPGMSGLGLQENLKAEGYRIPIIFITAHGDAKMRAQALRAGAVEFLTKPFNDEILIERVEAALEKLNPKAEAYISVRQEVPHGSFRKVRVR